MSARADESACVLIVEDEENIAAQYSDWLEDTYDVFVAHDGTSGLDIVSEHDIDVILLDRRMPEMSGDEMLKRVRNAGINVPVIMVTAIKPELDIIWYDFDDYLVKPVRQDQLAETVQHHLNRMSQAEPVQEYLKLQQRKRTLLENHSENDLSNNPNYQELQRRIDQLRDQAEDTLADIGEEEFIELGIRDIWLDEIDS